MTGKLDTISTDPHKRTLLKKIYQCTLQDILEKVYYPLSEDHQSLMATINALEDDYDPLNEREEFETAVSGLYRYAHHIDEPLLKERARELTELWTIFADAWADFMVTIVKIANDVVHFDNSPIEKLVNNKDFMDMLIRLSYKTRNKAELTLELNLSFVSSLIDILWLLHEYNIGKFADDEVMLDVATREDNEAVSRAMRSYYHSEYDRIFKERFSVN